MHHEYSQFLNTILIVDILDFKETTNHLFCVTIQKKLQCLHLPFTHLTIFSQNLIKCYILNSVDTFFYQNIRNIFNIISIYLLYAKFQKDLIDQIIFYFRLILMYIKKHD